MDVPIFLVVLGWSIGCSSSADISEDISRCRLLHRWHSLEAAAFAYFVLCFSCTGLVPESFRCSQLNNLLRKKGCCHTQHDVDIDVDVELGHVKLLSTSTKHCSAS